MVLKVSLRHKTEYQFDRAAAIGPHVLRLRPAPHCRTPIRAYTLNVEPGDKFLNWQQDPFGNYLARLVFPNRSRRLSFDVDVVAEMTVINPFDFFLEESAEKAPFEYSPDVARQLGPYLELTECGPRVQEWLSKFDRTKRRTVDFLVDLNTRVHNEVGYTIRMEAGVQSCEETLTKKSGSCRDSAWLLVQMMRHLGLAARFVSGYIIQLVADVKPLEGPAGPAKDFIDLHAWAEAYIPGAGWIGLDPTSGLFAGEGHIPLACAPHYSDAAPVTGATEACQAQFSFDMSIERIYEDPRVTKPYTDEQWADINRVGRRVDKALNADDVRLSMGGEPTFVSIDDMDGDEWNIAALGPKKRLIAGDLLRRLRNRFAPNGGVLHYGQGKWYPGEELPRWAFSLFWRKDGQPIWADERLLADETQKGSFTRDDAQEFAEALARNLGVAPAHLTPAFEDVYYYLWREGTLPSNVDPYAANLKDSLERRRLRTLLERGLEKTTGFALPLEWDWKGSGAWRSSPWPVRRERLYLLPGDSPMGYRLPLDSLPHNPRAKEEPFPERCMFELRPPLGKTVESIAHRFNRYVVGATDEVDEVREQSFADEKDAPSNIARTALCIEPRDGRIYLFLPPLAHLEHYLDLIHSIEQTATELQKPVVMEGYPPPHDWRIERLAVTPDPGVIEVNVHPSTSWDGLVDVTTILHEEARLARLGTEKFMLDGRHTGTGGGNHVTLGAAQPADSPFLRRPDLLASLLTYWQHHPSLSFLFSGMFIGPTSQSPRVDEARHENLYELELAFQQVPPGITPQPWIVDRLLRNLLVDVTGNTHRAEICIDKLHSPESMAGRLGIVELRGFEMPPHPRMSLVQGLLMRALVSRFWKTPYKFPLVRWGTELHDRFMLPHYIARDFSEVLADLRRAGFEFDEQWFAPFHEFRFPHYGSVQIGDAKLDLRMALEPWHVLGEETTSQGTARYVDSSVERMEVKAFGLTGGRHVVTCNGRRLPLRSTGRHSEYVAGLRYRAWQPPSALHPTIGIHAPLVFDVVDLWNQCSIGGCTYHVTHPGGLSFEKLPINAYEAESRRIARFQTIGCTPGKMNPPVEEPTDEYPYTLDLRRQAH